MYQTSHGGSLYQNIIQMSEIPKLYYLKRIKSTPKRPSQTTLRLFKG